MIFDDFKNKKGSFYASLFVAERVGFEPTVRLHVHTLSMRASSATPAPFRKN